MRTTRTAKLGAGCLVLVAVSLLAAANAPATTRNKLDLTWTAPEGGQQQETAGESFEMVLYHFAKHGSGPDTLKLETKPSPGEITCTGTDVAAQPRARGSSCGC